MAEPIRKIFIGRGNEAEKRIAEGWFVTENGGSDTTLGFLNRNYHQIIQAAGADAQTCMSILVSRALGLAAEVRVDLEDIRSHRETTSDINPLLIRAVDLAFSLNSFHKIDHPNLVVAQEDVWNLAKEEVKSSITY